MFRMIPFREEHLLGFCDQSSHKGVVRAWVDSGQAKSLEGPTSFSADWDGKILACGGIVKYWEGRGLIWVVFNEESKTSFVPLFRGIKRWLDEQPFTRIELSVPIDFPLGQRRAEMLGFELETPRARKYHVDGKDSVIYVLIKEGMA